MIFAIAFANIKIIIFPGKKQNGAVTKAPHEVGIAALGDPKIYKIKLLVLFNE